LSVPFSVSFAAYVECPLFRFPFAAYVECPLFRFPLLSVPFSVCPFSVCQRGPRPERLHSQRERKVMKTLMNILRTIALWGMSNIDHANQQARKARMLDKRHGRPSDVDVG